MNLTMARRRLALCLATLVTTLAPVGREIGVTPAWAAASPGYHRLFSAGSGFDVVASATHAYATNLWQNRVEVLSLATGALEAPIAVGSSPRALDLSPDGTKLYVVNHDGNDISVVDLALRHEIRRIPVPVGTNSTHPTSIAVAANGTALVVRDGMNENGQGSPLLQVDLATGNLRERPEARPYASGADRARVRASRDRSRIGVVDDRGEVGTASVYTASTDSFGPRRFVGKTPFVAVDGSGVRMLVGADTLVLDQDLMVRATIPGPGTQALVSNGSGTAGFRTREGKIEVLDPARGLVTGSIAVPGGPYVNALALTPDDATLVVLAGNGMAVVPVSAAVPGPGCASAPAVPSLVRVCGAPLTDVVVDARGNAYVTNRERNQVEVVSLASRTLGTPIPVGSQPRELDISADGNTLYVANAGGEDVSVVDLLSRREVRRVTLPSSLNHVDRPFSIAVANNGTGLLSTSRPGGNQIERFFQFDLLTGDIRERTDVQSLHLEASGDHSRIVTTHARTGGAIHVYSATTDTFGKGKGVSGELSMLAVDATASKMLFGPGTYASDLVTSVFDSDLVRRATIPTGRGLAVDRSGRTGYQVQPYEVEVLDLARGLPVSSVKLPELVPGTAKLAVTPDNTTLAVLTPSGVAVLAVAAATPLPPCSRGSSPPAGVIAVCGTLAEAVVDGTGRAFVTNWARNQVEVVNLATGALEAPILVGSRPHGLDLTSDGRTLYVADSGAEEISVVDLLQRREVRRITAPSLGSNDRPYSIAVGDRGRALVTTTGTGYGAHLLHLDLESETVAPRLDFGIRPGSITGNAHVRASGDRSRIAVVEEVSSGPVHMYDTASDSFGPERLTGDYLASVAVDRTGARLLTGNQGTFVLDGDLRKLATFPRGGKGVALNAEGTTGYRVQGSSVEVLDVDRGTVVRSIPLPEAVGAAGGLALSADGTTLVTLTHNGVVVVPARTATPQTPYSVWTQPQAAPLDGVGAWIGVVADPSAAAGQRPPTYLYGHYFGFANATALGVVGLMTDPAGKFAILSVAEPNGPPRTAAVRFNWSEGRFYFPFVYQLGAGSWGASIFDASTGAWTTIGRLSLPSQWGKLAATTVTAASWYGPLAPRCSAYPWADVVFSPPTGYAGSTVSTAGVTASGHNPGDCSVQSSVESTVWARYRLGAKP